MAISVGAIILAKRRALNNGSETLKAAGQGTLKWLFQYLSQFKGNPDLQVVAFDELSSTDVVIADAACKLYAIAFVKDTSTATFPKATDHASTASDAASELRFWLNAIGVQCFIWPDGLAFANGITMQGTTTADGGTGSASNGAKGFAIIGRP